MDYAFEIDKTLQRHMKFNFKKWWSLKVANVLIYIR